MTKLPRLDGWIVKGVAGRGGEDYAGDTDDIIKILAEGGIHVDYEDIGDHAYLLLKSADWWGPILVFTQVALANGAGGVLALAIWELIGRRSDTRLHIDVGSKQSEVEDVIWFRGDGRAEDVIAALKEWKGE